MIQKICPKCGNARINIDEPCCSSCKSKYNSIKKERYKRYSKVREDKDELIFYNSAIWKTVANKIRLLSCNCCLVCFYNSFFKSKDFRIINQLNYFVEDGKRRNLVHHIIELKEDKSKATVEENLICICEKHHKKIHDIYETENKNKLQKELQKLVRWYMENFI